jgi:hypothetical protein
MWVLWAYPKNSSDSCLPTNPLTHTALGKASIWMWWRWHNRKMRNRMKWWDSCTDLLVYFTQLRYQLWNLVNENEHADLRGSGQQVAVCIEQWGTLSCDLVLLEKNTMTWSCRIILWPPNGLNRWWRLFPLQNVKFETRNFSFVWPLLPACATALFLVPEARYFFSHLNYAKIWTSSRCAQVL